MAVDLSLVPYSEFLPVSVIISHRNSARTIGNCLSHLQGVDYPLDKFEVIVVDAGSTDGSIDIVEGFRGFNIQQAVKEGFTEEEGQSWGIQHSRGDVIMFTNSDIYVPRDWIKRHVGWLEKGYDMSGGAVFWSGDKFSLTWNLPLPTRPSEKLRPGLGLGFSNCSIDRRFLVHVGGLKSLRSQHDAEFALRSMKLGGKVIMDPSIEVCHDHPFKSFLENFRRSFGYAINHVTVIRATYGKMVSGSGSPMISSIGSFYRELALITSAKAYRESLTRARKWNIQMRVGPFDFVFIRLFSTRAGHILGILAGALPKRGRLSDIMELHSSKPTSPTMFTETANSTGVSKVVTGDSRVRNLTHTPNASVRYILLRRSGIRR